MTLRPMKRIDIVVDSLHLSQALDALRGAGASGYTVRPDAEGRGDRGDRLADELSGVSTNSHVFLAVEPDQVETITAAIGPLLSTYGGICLVGDCLWLEH